MKKHHCHHLLLISVLTLTMPFALAAHTLDTQKPDHLSQKEIEQVRNTGDPIKRIKLFLTFAAHRLLFFESQLRSTSEETSARLGKLQDRLNNFIRAIDDAAGHLEDCLERGRINLRDLQMPIQKSGTDFSERLQQARDQHAILETDLRWDMEDAIEATKDLLTLAEQITKRDPPARHTTYPDSDTASPQDGRPTLRRKDGN